MPTILELIDFFRFEAVKRSGLYNLLNSMLDLSISLIVKDNSDISYKYENYQSTQARLGFVAKIVCINVCN